MASSFTQSILMNVVPWTCVAVTRHIEGGPDWSSVSVKRSGWCLIRPRQVSGNVCQGMPLSTQLPKLSPRHLPSTARPHPPRFFSHLPCCIILLPLNLSEVGQLLLSLYRLRSLTEKARRDRWRPPLRATQPTSRPGLSPHVILHPYFAPDSLHPSSLLIPLCTHLIHNRWIIPGPKC